jgi:hypothetical protein
MVDFIVAADDYFTDDKGHYKFIPEEIMDAHDWCIHTTRLAMERGDSVAVHNTFTKNVFLDIYLDMAREFKYNVIEVVMKGSYDSIHGVPPATVNKMKLQLQKRLEDNWALS